MSADPKAVAIAKLDSALCNFINAISDPFTPTEDWIEESRRNLRALSDAYNECHKTDVMDLIRDMDLLISEGLIKDDLDNG